MIAREIPKDMDAERRVLACCMLDAGTLGRAVDFGLNSSSFYAEAHGSLFALMVEMMANGTPIDEVSVYQEIVRRRMTETFTGDHPFFGITSTASTTASAVQAIEIVAEKALLRRAIRISGLLVEQCYEYTSGGVIEALSGSIGQLLALSGVDGKPEPTWEEIVSQAETLTDEITSKRGRVASTVEFPWQQMNDLFGPMERGQLVILAARTSVGKSSLARPIAAHAAQKGNQVYFNTLEVHPVKVAMQMAATVSRIGVRKLGHVHSADQADFKRALIGLKKAGITMSRKDRCLTQIVARSKALAAQSKLDMIVVDHGGLLSDIYSAADKISAIGRVTKTLKHLATELNVVVVFLWQLNRDSVKDRNREPILSDLKDSGSLEEDADKVILIHRPSTDPITSNTQSDTATVSDCPRFFQNVIQAKGRDEGTSFMSFYFEREIASFTPAKKPC